MNELLEADRGQTGEARFWLSAANRIGKPIDTTSKHNFVRRLTLIVAPFVAVMALIPLLVVTIPPLHDYPGHLARLDALAVLTGHAHHPVHYTLGTFLLPNVAMDLVAVELTAVLPPILAGRVFLGIVLLLILSGTIALHRVLHGRFSPWPLIAGFFLYNWIFLFGFINYLFGIGAMLWGVAIWFAMARSSVATRLIAGTVIALAILVCHLEAFGLFGIILGADALFKTWVGWRRTRRVPWAFLLLPAVPLVIGLVCFLALSPTAGALHDAPTYAGWWGWKPLVAYRTLLWSIPWLNVVTIVPLAALAAWVVLSRRLTVAPVAWFIVPLLCLTFVVMPFSLSDALYVDARLPVVIMFVVIASTDIIFPAPRQLAMFVLACAALLTVHCTAIAANWYGTIPLYRQYEAAFDRLPAGAVLFVADTQHPPTLAYRSEKELAQWNPPLKHIASLASVGRDVFVAATWAHRFQQPIRVLPSDLPARELQGDAPFPVKTGEQLGHVLEEIRSLPVSGPPPPYFLLLLAPQSLLGDTPSGLSPIARGDTFTLFRVE